MFVSLPICLFFSLKCFQILIVQFLGSHSGKDSGKAFKTQCSVSKNRLKALNSFNKQALPSPSVRGDITGNESETQGLLCSSWGWPSRVVSAGMVQLQGLSWYLFYSEHPFPQGITWMSSSFSGSGPCCIKTCLEARSPCSQNR